MRNVNTSRVTRYLVKGGTMKKLALITIVTLLALPLLLSACEGADYQSMPNSISPAEPPMPSAPGMDMDDGGYKEYEYTESAPATSGEGASIPVERIIVRNADMSLVVEDVLQTRDEIEALATSLGGWVVNSNIYDNDTEISGWVSIRIPSEQFDPALEQLRAMAVRVTSETTSSQDVTEEYVDLQSRLNNAEATEAQYLTLLETATEVEDILRIYESLSQIRYEIEQIKGRLQYLEQISATSMISINLTPEVSLGPTVPPGWSASETLNAAIRGLSTFGQGLGSAFIWIGIFSPIWGTILGIALWRRHKRRQKLLNPETAAPEPADDSGQ
jgi:hypothetical protein